VAIKVEITREAARVLRRVAGASARTYEGVGDEAHEAEVRYNGASCMVILPSLRRVEYVRGDIDLGTEDLAQLRRLRQDFEVWFLMPLELVGRAHALLRGRVDQLQPWWLDGSAVRFGAPRIP
jgi:hypothetical protein